MLSKRVILLLGASAATVGWIGSQFSTGTPRANRGIVLSGSMEPAIPSPLLLVTCSHCSQSFATIESTYDKSLPAICIHCGSSQVDVSQAPEPTPLKLREITPSTQIAIGDIIAFRNNDTQETEVKRIVGLPRNQVEIQDGDLWIDESRYEKPFNAFLRQAILVDSQTMNTEPSRWKSEGNQYVYHHQTFQPDSTSNWRPRESQINDEFWMNQGERLSGLPVQDVGLVFDFKVKSRFEKLNCTFRIDSQIHHVGLEKRQNRWSITHQLDNSSSKDSNDQPLEARSSANFLNDKEPSWFAFACVDGRLMAGTDSGSFELGMVNKAQRDSNLETADVELSGVELSDVEFSGVELSFAMAPDASSIRTLMVIRDIYYRRSVNHPDGMIQEGISAESNSEAGYVVLGDNVAFSDDSRQRLEGGVSRGDIKYWVELPSDPLYSLRRQSKLYRMR